MGSKDKMLSYRSEISGAIHEMMSDAHKVGVVSTETLRSFDATCLPATPALAAEEI
jgi:putative transcriptional regulator